MLSTRILTALIGIPVLILSLYLGGTVFAAVIGIIAFLSLKEFYGFFSKQDIKIFSNLGLAVVAVLPLIAYFFGATGLVGVGVSPRFIIMLWKIFSDKASIEGASITFLGVAYIGLALAHLVLIENFNTGALFVLFTFVATWIADTSAYGVGRVIGSRPLAKKISPKKTVEGFIGAIVINSFIFSLLIWVPLLTVYERMIFAASITVLATLGDLVESSIKREVGVKDSGTLIPGHGGFLDRFDSMIFTGVGSYYLILLFIKI